MGFGTETEEGEAFAILDRFIEAGGNLVDTANVYGGGASESLIGCWFADRPADITDRVVLATTARFGTGPDANDASIVAPQPRPRPDRVATTPRPREGRPLPAARLGPADPDR